MQDETDDIVRAVIEAAKTAMRLCVERLIPVRKARLIEFDLPPVKTASDVTEAIGMIAKASAPKRRP